MALTWYRVGVVLVTLLTALGAFRLTAFVVERGVARSIRKRHDVGDADW